MEQLIEVQRKFVEYLRERRRLGEPCPTYREAARAMGWRSTATVRDMLAALERKGKITRSGHRSRSVTLREPVPEAVELPIVGQIVAGIPVVSEEVRGETVAVPSGLVHGDCFALRVSGESMIGAGILDGDTVVVRRQPSAQTGDIVAATVDGETTLKAIIVDGAGTRLEAANPRFAPIPLHGAVAVTVHGVVVGLLRSYGTKLRTTSHL